MPVYEYRGKYYESAETDPGKAKTKILQFLQSTPEGKQRTYGEAFQDVGAGVVGGIGSLVQTPGQLYGLVTGDMRPTGISLGGGQKLKELAESLKSPGLKAREQARAEAIEKATQEGGQLGAFTTTLSQTVKDPGLLLNFLAEQAPQLLIPFGAAKIGKGIASLAGAGQATAATAGVGSAIVAGAVQQGADVGEGAYRNIYEELKRKGATDEEAAEGAINLARSAGASGAVISGLAQLLPGARGIERAFARAPAAQTVIPRVATGAAGEAGAEIAEEVGGKLAQNVAMQQVKPEQSLTEGLGQTAGLAAIGGGVLGGAAGLVPRPQPEPPPPAPPPPLPPPAPPPPVPPPAPPQPPTPEQQRIDTVTGVSREPAVRQEGLLSAQEAAAQEKERRPLRPGEARAKLPEFERGVASLLKPGETRVEDMPEFQQTASKFGLRPGETKVDRMPEFEKPATAEAQQIQEDIAAREKIARDAERKRVREVQAIPGEARAASEEMLDIIRQLQLANLPNTRNPLTTKQREYLKNRLIELQKQTKPQPKVGPDTRPKVQYRGPLAQQLPTASSPEDIAARQAEIDRRRQEAGFLTAEQRRAGIIKVEKPKIGKAPIPKLVDPRPLTEQQANARLGVLKDMLQIEGGDPNSLGIVPHPTVKGKFAIKSFDLPFKLSTAQQATAFGTPEKPVVIDPVEAYVNIARQTNTPAAQRFVRDWEAGRIPREDVQRALQTERQVLQLPPLTFLGSPPAKISQQPIAGPTLQGVRDVFDRPVTNVARPPAKPYDLPPPVQQLGVTIWFIEPGQVETTSNIELPALSFLNNQSFDPVEYYVRMLTEMAAVEPTTQEERNQQAKIKAFLGAYNQNKIPRTFIEKALRKQGGTTTAQPPTQQPPTEQPPSEQPVSEEQPISFEEFKLRMPVARQNAEVLAANNQGNIKKLGEALAKSSNPAIAKIGELTKLIVGKVTLKKPTRFKKGTAGMYTYIDDSIQMDRDYAGDEHTNAHELVHGLISRSQRFPGPRQLRYANDIKTLYQHVKKELAKIGMGIGPKYKTQVYGLTNEREFTAEAMTNPQFQYILMQIPYKGKKSAWAQFVQAVAKLLGIKDTNALTEVMSLVESLAKVGRPRTTRLDPKLIDESVNLEERAQQILQKRPPLKLAPEITEEERRRLQETFAPDNKTIIDKVRGLEDRFWQRMAQKFADQFRTIKDYSEKGYMQARLSKAIDGAVEGLLFYGQVFNDGGALNIRSQTKGLIDILKPVGPEVDNFMIWIALNRETNLRAQEKEPSIPDDVLALKNKLSAGMIGNQTRLQVYNDVLREMNALNKSVLTVALNSGLIDQNAFQRFSEDIYYVPFYKAIENEDIEAPMLASGLTGQYFSKQLKGGEKKFGDLVENTLLNWNHILSAAMKNQAAVQTIRDASTFMMGDEAVVEPTTEKTGAAKVMIDGQARYFRINDPLLFESIGSIGYIGGQSYAIDIMRPFKNLLQMGVTISPQFRVNNLIRDSISSLAVTPINKNFAMNVLTGVSVYREKGGTFISALSGGAIFNFGTAYEGNQSVMIKRLIERGVNPDTILDDENKIKKGLKFLWDKYQDWGNASEAANRLALYKQLRDRGLSHLEATFQARDLLDFSMQGSWPTFRFLTQVVPFLNARVQGLYKLGRDGISPTVRVLYNSATGREIEATDAQKARAFSTVSMAVVLASMALYGAFKDDEEFKKRDDWDRDNFWWFRLPNMDVAFRIPKPFEIGAFGTLAERILEQMFDEEAEGKVFGDTLVRMLTDTFAINPTPQLFKPLLDIYANENAFTGAPIETEGQERLSKQERYNDRTSALAKALGGITGAFLPEEIELSPVQIDHLIQGYLGWLGATIATTSNYAVMPFNEGEYPDANWINRASLGLARDLPSPYSKYVTAFYKNGKAINQAYADMRHYAAIGESEEVQRILEERGDKVSLAKLYDKTAKEMAKVRQHIRVIVADPQMTGAEKREEIDRLNMLIGEMAQNAEEIRRSVYAEQ